MHNLLNITIEFCTKRPGICHGLDLLAHKYLTLVMTGISSMISVQVSQRKAKVPLHIMMPADPSNKQEVAEMHFHVVFSNNS